MRIIILTICALCFAQARTFAQSIIYQPEDSTKVVELLAKAPILATTNEYMTYFGRQLLGTPYVAKTLEKGTTEHLVVNLRELDCTTFVETILALSLCMKNAKPSFQDYCNYLRLIRYDGGVVAYENRLHYFSSWIESNASKGFVLEGRQDSLQASGDYLPRSLFEEVQTLNTTYMTTHPEQYPFLKNDTLMVSKIKKMEQSLCGKQYRFIPKRLLQRGTSQLKKYIKNGDIIAIVTSKAGLDIAHLGIASWHSDGTLHLINASQIHKKVIDEPMTLYNYIQKHPSQLGIRVIKPI